MSKIKIRPLVAGNWKMNGTVADLCEARLLASMLHGVKLKCDIVVCPPLTLMRRVKSVLRTAKIKIGAQDCHKDIAGAYTGDVSAEMLKDAGCSATLVGHSERRYAYGESDILVCAKARAAHRAGITAIICIGEDREQRQLGETLRILSTQLRGCVPQDANSANTVIAYEPVWAIGTGITPKREQILEAHFHIRTTLISYLGHEHGSMIRLLYGGSVKPSNAEELMNIQNVNGALVGGASLKAADFIGILKTYI